MDDRNNDRGGTANAHSPTSVVTAITFNDFSCQVQAFITLNFIHGEKLRNTFYFDTMF